MENINEQFKRLFCELDLTDDQAAMIKKLQRDVYAALRQPPVIGSVCHCDKLPEGEIAISSKALQKPYGDLGQTDY